MPSKTFGEMVGSVLKQNRYSQRSLAVEIDRSNTYIHNIIRGKTKQPERDKVVEIARLLNLDVEESLKAAGHSLIEDVPPEIVKAIATVPDLNEETIREIVRLIGMVTLRQRKAHKKSGSAKTEIAYKKGVSEHETQPAGVNLVKDLGRD